MEVLHETDILIECLRKLLLFSATGKILIPALELSIYWSDFSLSIEWELVSLLAVDNVRGADLDSLECVEAVRLHHDEVCYTIEHYGVLESYEVQPTASA